MKYSFHFSDESITGKIRNWVVDRPWLAKVIEDAYTKGGVDSFPLAQKDVLETMRNDIDKQVEELADKKLSELLSTVDVSMIVSADSRTKQLLIGGEKVDEGRLMNLKSEAEFLLASDLWKLIYETPKALAERAMFVDDGRLDNQLLKGRVILFTLATQKKLIDIFKSKTVVPTSHNPT